MSPSGLEKALSQINVFKEFTLINTERDGIPSASCIKDFNALLEKKSLALKINQAFNMEPINTNCAAVF